MFSRFLSLAIINAPSFLLLSEAPVKADAVVLFLGGEKGAREKEAEQLLREGFADYLITPATGQIMKRGPDGNLVGVDFDSKHVTSNLKLGTSSWFENTHIEVLGAKRLMENLGLRSALFVSSPYHMRRIRIIAGYVFAENNPLSSSPPLEKEGRGGFIVYAVPTRYETPGETYWLFSNREREFVLMEYAKIIWFLLYSSFSFLVP